MTIEFESAVKAILRDAAHQRRLYKKHHHGRFKVRANALEQLAVRVRRAVPSDPDSEDLARLAHEMCYDQEVEVTHSRIHMVKFSKLRGRTWFCAHVDDFTMSAESHAVHW